MSPSVHLEWPGYSVCCLAVLVIGFSIIVAVVEIDTPFSGRAIVPVFPLDWLFHFVWYVCWFF